MLQTLILTAGSLALALAGLLATATAAEPGHHHHHQAAAAPQQLALDNGSKWQTDQPLRDGMNRMRQLLAPQLAAIHHGRLGDAAYRQLGGQIEQQLADIVANCKLSPKADAMLHLLVAELQTGAAAMQGKGTLQPAAGAHKVVQALNNYGRYFQHPGWLTLR